MDYWQLCGTLAAAAFTVGFIGQVLTTYQTRDVAGLSQLQWMMFAAASSIFAAYYAHLEQWMMVGVSVFGTVCCLSILLMIFSFKDRSKA